MSSTTKVPSGLTRVASESHTLGQMVLESCRCNRGPALRWRGEEGWEEMSYVELHRAVREIAGGLIALGIEAGDRVSILSDTRPEWTLADFGSLCAGAVVAPIYQTNSPEECRYVLNHSGARVVFCENAAQLAKIEEIRDECPDLEYVIAFTDAPSGNGVISLDELRLRGAGLSELPMHDRLSLGSPRDLATLIYTSGTTGPPKGCMLTHDNFLSATRAYEQRLELTASTNTPLVFFMFLPLAHSLARIIQMAVTDLGGTLVFWRGDRRLLLEDLKESQPTYFPSVPHMFEKVYTAAHAGIEKQSPVRRRMFDWAVGTGRAKRARERSGRRASPVLIAEHALADRLVLSRVRALFGGRLVLAATGAAPIARDILEFFDACGILVLEGWGMTETSAAGAINTPSELKFGTVGRPLPGTELRVAQDGELLVRGPCVFQGYYRDEEATREAFVDVDWLATGDLGAIDDEGYVSITGRKKDLIITSSGKNITPTNIENQLKESRWISEAVVFGDRRPYLVAMLTLDPEEAPHLALRLGIEADIKAMVKDDRVLAELAQAVEAVNSRFARIEQIKRFGLLDRDLAQIHGEMTPTMKVKRNVVYRKFEDFFTALYERDD